MIVLQILATILVYILIMGAIVGVLAVGAFFFTAFDRHWDTADTDWKEMQDKPWNTEKRSVAFVRGAKPVIAVVGEVAKALFVLLSAWFVIGTVKGAWDKRDKNK